MIRVAMAATHTAAMAATRTAAMATAISATVSTTIAPSVTATTSVTASTATTAAATAIFRIGGAHDGQVNGKQWRGCKHQGAGKDRKKTFIL